MLYIYPFLIELGTAFKTAPDATAHAATCDLSNAEAITHYIAEAAAALGGIDILVNNAGSIPKGHFETVGDVAAIATTARRDAGDWVLDGEKTWISNGGIAAFYVVFARSGEAPGTRGLTAFVVDADTPGLDVIERIETIAPHPLATLRLRDCRVPDARRLGAPGEGFKVAMRTLDVFRTSVAGAAVGLARRACDAAVEYATGRRLFGSRLADFQLSQAALAQMNADVDASALLTYRAAWTRDVRGESATREAALAKWIATESAQRTIDRTVQFFGALGVTRGNVAEGLYREIRALRIYEGASEVQQTIVARALLAGATTA